MFKENQPDSMDFQTGPRCIGSSASDSHDSSNPLQVSATSVGAVGGVQNSSLDADEEIDSWANMHRSK